MEAEVEADEMGMRSFSSSKAHSDLREAVVVATAYPGEQGSSVSRFT